MIYKLYSDIVPVKGYYRGILYDFGKEKRWIVPNSLLSIINKDNSLKRNIYSEQYSEYLNFLKDEKLIFEILAIFKKSFPIINFDYFTYSKVNNLVIEINNDTDINNIVNIISGIENKLFCYHLVFILDDNLNKWVDKFHKIIYDDLLENIVSIGVKSLASNKEEIDFFLNKNSKINALYLTDKDTHKTTLNSIYKSTLIYNVPETENKPTESVMHPDLFALNLNLFSESQKHNTYFNRKLYIGSDGEIKNAPETTAVFGNINNPSNESDLIEIIESKEFQKYWDVHKGLIDVCKHCEFRYMCVDNRVPSIRSEKEWYHETECNYNPYIAKWKGEENYKTLAECGITVNSIELKINTEKLNAVNWEIWGDE